MTDNGADLVRRIASALVFGAVTVAAVWAGGWFFLAFLLICGLVAAREWGGVTGGTVAIPAVAALVLVGLLALEVAAGDGIATATGLTGGFAQVIVVGAVALAAALIHRLTAPQQGRAFWTGLGVLLIGLSLLAFADLRSIGRDTLIWLFAVVWATDIGAMATGRTLKGPRLWPRVSPNKRLSGAIGGLVAGAGAGTLAGVAIGCETALPGLLASAASLSLVSQAGDLAESAWKRHFGVKDSGAIMPGHGGLLDRIDGLAVAAMAFALFAG